MNFLKDNNLNAIQVTIAEEVNRQIEKEIDKQKFEEICEKIYDMYGLSEDSFDIWRLVHKKLIAENLKEEKPY